ncbi:hypothetical protein ACWEIJ_25625 [Lentzea sp. NPDC004789]
MSAVVRLVGLVVVLVGLLSGCNVFSQYHEDVDELGKKIVADWKEQPEVADARHDYRHGVDQGQIMYVIVIIRAESDSNAAIAKLKDIAIRDYWLSTAYDAYDLSLRFVAYSSDNPPVEDGAGGDRAIFRETIGVPEKVGREKYGPRPTER